jgi:hypothetical protein
MITVLEDLQHMAVRRQDQSWSHVQLQTLLATTLMTELKHLQQLKDGSLSTRDERADHFLKQMSSAVINALVRIADGVAFRFLNFDQGICQIFRENETSPYAVTQEGFWNAFEVASVMNDTVDPDAQVLMCDLNEITNIGDVIVKRAGGFELVEVKQSTKARGSRLARQKARLQAIVSLVNERRGVLDNREVQLIDRPSRKTYMADLAECLRDSQEHGAAVRKLTDYMSLSCIDLKAVDRDDTILTLVEEQTKEFWYGHKTVEISSLLTRQWPEFVPMTVFPLDTASIIELLMGFKVFNVTLSLDALRATFEAAGWDVVDFTEVEKEDHPFFKGLVFWLLQRENPNRNIGFSADHLLQTAANLMDVDDFLRTATAIVESRPELTHWVMSYPDERALWR